jgi:hypothetical protein
MSRFTRSSTSRWGSNGHDMKEVEVCKIQNQAQKVRIESLSKIIQAINVKDDAIRSFVRTEIEFCERKLKEDDPLGTRSLALLSKNEALHLVSNFIEELC